MAGLPSISCGSPAVFVALNIEKVPTMALVLTSGPLQEPLALADVKAHLRIDDSAEDILLSSLLLTSRLHIESILAIALITQSWMMVLDRWPSGDTVTIPMSPLQQVSEVRVRDASGTPAIISTASYTVETASRPARLVWKNIVSLEPGLRAGGIEINFTAGFGATGDSVPAPLKHAILLLTAHWYEHRDPVEIGSSAAKIPDAVTDLIQPFRKIRL